MAGHGFHFDVTVPLLPASVDSAALGVSAAAKLSDKDVNKIVKLGPLDNYVLVADGDDIEGVIRSVEPHTVNEGFSFGSVQTRFQAEKVRVTGAALAVGATVVAAAQAAIGTAQPYPLVKAGAGAVFKWRVKSLLGGTGAVGSEVLIEPITR